MDSELTQFFAYELAAMIREKRVSPVEVVQAFLNRIELCNPKFNAIVTLAPDALANARESEAAVMHGTAIGPMHGVPITIKDTIGTAGMCTTAGSLRLVLNVSMEDAPAVARLKQAGAIILGKTNVPELAMTYETENKLFGATPNPYGDVRTSGGSSGGETAAIAVRMSPAGLGSDLAGSIRIPANFCGVFGLKPSPGIVPNGGHIPPASGSMKEGAVFGPIARTTEDLRLMMQAMSSEREFEQPLTVLPTNKWRISWFVDDEVAHASDEICGEIRRVVEVFTRTGATASQERPPGVERSTELWTSLFSREAAAFADMMHREHSDDAGAFVRFIIHSYRESLLNDAEIKSAAKTEVSQRRNEIISFFDRFDFIVAPVGAVGAFRNGTRKVIAAGREISVFKAFGYSHFSNVFGLPSIAVPTGFDSDGFPLGVQLIGSPKSDHLLLRAASHLERELALHSAPGPVLC